MKLNCPLPEAVAIVWTKDGTSLIPDNRTLIEREQLHIRRAAPTDSGLYACQATGAKATDVVCFIVNVTGETPRPKENSNRPSPSLIREILLKNGNKIFVGFSGYVYLLAGPNLYLVSLKCQDFVLQIFKNVHKTCFV